MATIKVERIFDLDCSDDRVALDDMMNASEFRAAIQEFDEWLRGIIKYGPSDEKIDMSSADIIRSKFYEILTENRVSLYD